MRSLTGKHTSRFPIIRLRTLICTFIAFVAVFPCTAEESWIDKVEKSLSKSITIGKQYVFIVAIDRYDDKGWADLRHPVRDAREIREILLSDYYIDEIIELYDEQATKERILRTFSALQNTLTSDDSLFILYTGHGYYDKDVTQTGFWIPANAGYDKFKQENWIPNPQIRGIIAKFEAKHILLVSDSCFAGDIIEVYRGDTALDADAADEHVIGSINKVSREVITSGSLEYVPDDSEFADQIKLSLAANTQSYYDSIDLYQSIRTGIMQSKPVYAVFPTAKHQQGGSFFFYRKPEAERIPCGTLSLKVRKPGSVFVNGKYVALIGEKDNLVREYPPDRITVTLRYEDGSESSRQVEIKSGIASELFFEDYPIDRNLGDSRIILSAGGGMNFPLDVYWSDLTKTGVTADISLQYAILLPVGYLPLGLAAGLSVLSMEEDLEDTYTSYTVPLGFVIGYTYTFPFPLSLFIEARAGFTLGWFDYKMSGRADAGPLTSPFISTACGIGVYATERISLSVLGCVSWKFYGNITYTDVLPGIRCNVNM